MLLHAANITWQCHSLFLNAIIHHYCICFFLFFFLLLHLLLSMQLSTLNYLTLHVYCLIAISYLFLFVFFLLLIRLVAPQVALSTAPSDHVANSKRGRSSGIHTLPPR